jgi:uncharacterized repeat protein (TIGR01451 family)
MGSVFRTVGGRLRAKKVWAVFSVVLAASAVLVLAPAALAWHSSLSASMDCYGVVSFTVTADVLDSTRTNPNIALFDDAALTHEVASGSFSSTDNWSFSGTFMEPASVTTLTLTAEALGPWADGHFEAAPSSATVTRPSDCPLSSLTSTVIHSAAEQVVTTVPVGSTVHDLVTVTGSDGGPTPSGSVTVDWFATGSCSGAAVASSGPIALVGGQAHATGFSQTPATPGSYGFKAHYGGDATYLPSDGPCEPLTVTQAAPSMTTTASGPITVGGAMYDAATLTGAVTAIGPVTFTIYGPGDTSCTTALATLGSAGKTVDPNGNGTYTSAGFSPLSAGVYRWRAFFTGDATNTPTSTACNDANETSTATPATPSISTSATLSVTLGDTIRDRATLSGAIAATGAVTFKLYAPGDSTCSSPITTLGTASSTVDTNGNGSYTSATFTPGATGAYRWRAFFAGDANNGAASTACNEAGETSTVNAPPPPPVPTPGLTTPPVAPSPAISITKGPEEQSVLTGGTAIWTIVVTNTGNVALTNVRVADALAQDCARTSVDIPALGVLAPGASIAYQCMLTKVTTSLTNTATVTGTPPTGPDVTSTDTAHATVTPPPNGKPAAPPSQKTSAPTSTPHRPKPRSAPLMPAPQPPRIAIVKDPKSQTIQPGGTARFRITVKNTGGAPLHNVRVRDPHSPDCNRTLGRLAPGRSASYSCARHEVAESFNNVAEASGTPPVGPSVTSRDHAPVTVAPPTKQPKTPKVVAQHHKPKMTG